MHTSAMLKPVERVKLVVTMLWKSPQTEKPWTEKYPVTRDVWEAFSGGDWVAGGWEQLLDPDAHTLKWIKGVGAPTQTPNWISGCF